MLPYVTFFLLSPIFLLAFFTIAQIEEYPFRNPKLPWDERVDDLVSRLTLTEIQLQMARGGAGKKGGPAPAISRLGIEPYQWDTECLTGDAQASRSATGFPTSIGMAATFSSDLVHDVARATGYEVRGKHNYYMSKGDYSSHTGLSCFSPVINILRDPRWGRNQETYGEDPYLAGQLSRSFVHGLQGNHSRFVLASAGCKHFDVHGGPENIPVSRFSFNANVSEADWRMTHLPAFKQCVTAGTYSLMCSYNRINGVPACANPKLLTDILRKEWGFKGYVVSDQGAIENIISYHKYLKTKADTVAACVSAGCNLELSSNLEDAVYMHLEQAVKMGKLTEAVVRERVKPLFYTRMRLGEFDPPESNPYWSLGEEQVETAGHQALAVTAAAHSYVLLKNQNDLLPLDEGRFKNVALIGPMSDNWRQLFSTYSANQPRNYTKTPLDALKQVYPNIRHGKACMDNTTCTVYHSDVVGQTVQNAELVFVALGTGTDVEREGKDRPDVNLPGHQKQLLLDVITQVGSDAKVILLLFSAGPLNITFADVNPRLDAILECFFPGQGTGEAIINVLFNKGGNSSPAGRLPMTWPKYAWQIPSIVNYSMSGRTYRYLQSEPLYPFGYGLSYTQFRYSNLTAATSHQANLDLEATVHVTNTDKLDADEVVQCYIGPSRSPLYPIPRRSLGFFQRVHMPAGHTVKVSAALAKETWAVWTNDQWTYTTGEMIVSCGGGQPGARGASTVSVIVNFTV